MPRISTTSSQQRVPMLEQAQEVLQSGHWVGLADTGYHSGEQIHRAEERGFEIYVPEPKTNTAAAKDGRFTRNRFQYDAAQDRNTCPHGATLEACGQPQEWNGKRVQAYKSKVAACTACPRSAWQKSPPTKSSSAGSTRRRSSGTADARPKPAAACSSAASSPSTPSTPSSIARACTTSFCAAWSNAGANSATWRCASTSRGC